MLLIPILMYYYTLIQSGNTSPEIIRDYINIEALIVGVDPQMVQSIVTNESQFNCNQIGDHGTSYGCWQIHLPAHKEISKEQAYDIIWSTEWSLEQLKQGKCKMWSTCPEKGT